MSDDLPADTPELEPARTFDSARLIAEVRRGEVAAIEEAYRLTFGSHLGRVVLLHALASIGKIGAPRTAEPLDQANHNNGRASAVLEIASLAGFDPVAIAAAGLTQALEGANHERHFGPDPYAGAPAVTFSDADADAFTGGADPDPFAFSSPDGTEADG